MLSTHARPWLSPAIGDPLQRCTGRVVPRSRSRHRYRRRESRLAHNRVRGAMRIDRLSGSDSGQQIGHLPCPAPACLCRGVVADVRPLTRAHMPLEGGVQIPCGFVMFGDQCCVLVDGPLRFDRRSHAPVQSRAIGFQLRFVGDSADQGVAECVFGAGRELHLINEFGSDQRIDIRVVDQAGQEVGVKA